MKQSVLLIAFCCLSISSCVCAQKSPHTIQIAIPEVALLAVKSTNNASIQLSGLAPSEAGVAMVFQDINKEMWLNYSSIIGSDSEPTRSISVQLTEGKIPKGLALSVVAGGDVGKGDGNLGEPKKKELRLSEHPKVIIKSIGSCYTGKGVQKGHNLSYSLALLKNKKSYSELDFDASSTLTITYTLSDN